jgi:predicted DNA repair protein MutK
MVTASDLLSGFAFISSSPLVPTAVIVPSALMIASLSEVLLLPTLMIGEKLPDFVAE